ncbi:U3 small nucleolar RNA-associated protein 18 homolog [Denticeps clupeoides]|uniref:U3 small nucleolar RNA-associated protein 18 homolog n=1 Tax=Denticeps clupeoides TaxID=299321 RepID=A0AAY4C4I5_9TELE|nr:U3 small nucleolar RNA-associated protein 18 homolog [Denticeps clupeoides]
MEAFIPDVRKSKNRTKRAPATDLKREEVKRQKHVKLMKALGEEDESVKELEKLVFGGEEDLVERLEDRGASLLEDDESSASEEENEARLQLPESRKAAWEDDDDGADEEVDMTHRFRRDFTKSDAEAKMPKQKLQQRLKEQFQKAMGGTPSWAETKVKKNKKRGGHEYEDDDDDDEEEEDSLLQKTGNFVGTSESLPKGIIRMKKCLNANNDRPAEDRLSTVQFHPSAQVVMTAGLDHSISLFQVDGKTNPKIQSIHLEKFPVNKACFSTNGEQVVATGLKNKLFYIYDMMEGKIIPVPTVRGLNEKRVKEFEVSPEGESLLFTGSAGYLHLMTMKTREVVRTMKVNGSVCGTAFSADGSKIFSSTEEGEVFIWDVRSSRCLNRFVDDGCIKGTSIAVSRDGQYLACGSQSGVVNVYSQASCLTSSQPKPLKAIMNLLTPATSLRFNPTSEILAIASRSDDEANRLVHLPSLTVFSNFPMFRRKTIYRTFSLDFSPNSGFYSVANNKGDALLFRLLHYGDF